MCEVYSLTELRIAAGIWMALVAVGLVLICLRIELGKSNLWLIAMNLYALGAAIYLSAFLDFSAVIARFNVDHSYELSGEGVPLDIGYLASSGPGAIPALDEYLVRLPKGPSSSRGFASALRGYQASTFKHQPTDWRSWSFRDQRLADYLASEPAVAMPPETTQNGASHR